MEAVITYDEENSDFKYLKEVTEFISSSHNSMKLTFEDSIEGSIDAEVLAKNIRKYLRDRYKNEQVIDVTNNYNSVVVTKLPKKFKVY